MFMKGLRGISNTECNLLSHNASIISVFIFRQIEALHCKDRAAN